ncbi:MAG: hypothetical protein KGQ89_00525 [Verrucomicrobia bacterium]|nr:hypothetical protein [Verrucomicrobiota bacterium]
MKTSTHKNKATFLSSRFWLHRLAAVLLPVVLAAASLAEPEADKPAKPAIPAPPSAAFWAESVSAESNKEYDKALEQLMLYQKADGDKFLSSLRYGWLCYLKQDYEKAETGYNSALKIEHSSLNAAVGLLDVAQMLKDKEKIKRAAEGILRISPTHYRASMVAGAIQYEEKDYRKASLTYHRVLTQYPDDVDAMSGAAWADLYSGSKREALDNFKKILGVKPTYSYAQLGYDLCMGKGQR